MIFKMQQLELFNDAMTPPPISLEDVFAAYYKCRKNKRRTMNALKFEMNLEENLVQLWRELNDGSYKIGRSIAFIVKNPVIREVFAADFRDRIVHHLLIGKLWPIFDRVISPHSYSCRPGMGTLYGIKKVYQYVKECSNNYTQDCYVMRLDIRAFFMHIRQKLLVKMLAQMVNENYHAPDKAILIKLIKQIVYYPPQRGCVIKGRRSDWNRLPRAKSLFYVRRGRGLPIGNLTSQIFANFYLNTFDRFVSEQAGVFYGRYVDDMVVIHKSKSFLLRLKGRIQSYLKARCFVILHPRKSTVQHYVKGFAFIGAYLKPHRLYAGRRLKLMFYTKIKQMLVVSPENALSVINSYFGFLRHYSTLHLRLKGWRIVRDFLPRFFIDNCVLKVFSPMG